MQKNLKFVLVILIIIVLGAGAFWYFRDSENSENEESKKIGEYTIIEQSEIYEFDANLDRNVEKYPGKIVIENLEVLYTTFEDDTPIICSKYTSSDGPMEWFVEYTQDDYPDLKAGDIINIYGEFKDTFKRYDIAEDDDPEEASRNIWPVSFLADKVEISK